MIRRACLQLVIVLISSTLSSQPSNGEQAEIYQSSAVEAYRLGAGDELRIIVFGHKDLSGDFTVNGGGVVALPLIGNVKAAGLELKELEQNFIETLKPDYLKNPSVSIEVLNYRPFYIMGEVKRPGSYAFVHGMTTINAVALAGGFTRRAQEGNLLIIRANDADRTKQLAGQGTVVLPGDVIEVPERFF
ncbi:MAG: protein involved in polysaccharide export with SLBB domain [Paracoccaceae bacterium]|jgi:protein involved in polysaccharide export with SLBB domain